MMAPQFWRFIPALALIAAPLFVVFAWLFSDALAMMPGFDGETFRTALIGGLITAGIAFYQAPRIDRVTAIAIVAAALGIGWCLFAISGHYGFGVGLIELMILGLWIFIVLAILASAYQRIGWLRWLALPVLFLASAACALWLGHEVIFVYGPMMIAALNPP